jgi:LPXTG-motif cell wall-anchored protein
MPWFGDDITIGLGALGVMFLLFFLVWLTLRKKSA